MFGPASLSVWTSFCVLCLTEKGERASGFPTHSAVTVPVKLRLLHWDVAQRHLRQKLSPLKKINCSHFIYSLQVTISRLNQLMTFLTISWMTGGPALATNWYFANVAFISWVETEIRRKVHFFLLLIQFVFVSHQPSPSLATWLLFFLFYCESCLFHLRVSHRTYLIS